MRCSSITLFLAEAASTSRPAYVFPQLFLDFDADCCCDWLQVEMSRRRFAAASFKITFAILGMDDEGAYRALTRPTLPHLLLYRHTTR